MELGELTISAWKGAAEARPSENGIHLNAETRWLVEGPSDEIDSLSEELGQIGSRVGPALLLDFGNSVGRFETHAFGTLRVTSGKWDEPHFHAMLEELTDVAVSLPFSVGAGGALPYDRSELADDRILYQAFVYLRHFLSRNRSNPAQLEAAYSAILAEPHRELERARESVAIDQAGRLDSKGLHDLITKPKSWSEAREHHQQQMPAARALGGRLPHQVDQARAKATFDTPENRFAKAFLAQMVGVIEEMREVISGVKPSAFTRRILQDCDRMQGKLRSFRRASFWREVGPMTFLPAGSTVLQKRRGYRQLFEHFSKLRLASSIPFDKDHVKDLLELKDIALLYELWCYFRLVDILRERLGPPRRAVGAEADALKASVKWGASVEWSDGTRLVYNPRFAHHNPPPRKAYSVGLRPDFALYVPAGPNEGLHLLDAKFRLRSLKNVMPEDDEESDEIEREERRGRFKRADLYKMHTYRDAITDARSVWILYPGSEHRFFGIDGTRKDDFEEVEVSLEGVGALPLLPDGDSSFARDFLDRVGY